MPGTTRRSWTCGGWPASCSRCARDPSSSSNSGSRPATTPRCCTTRPSAATALERENQVSVRSKSCSISTRELDRGMRFFKDKRRFHAQFERLCVRTGSRSGCARSRRSCVRDRDKGRVSPSFVKRLGTTVRFASDSERSRVPTHSSTCPVWLFGPLFSIVQSPKLVSTNLDHSPAAGVRAWRS